MGDCDFYETTDNDGIHCPRIWNGPVYVPFRTPDKPAAFWSGLGGRSDHRHTVRGLIEQSTTPVRWRRNVSSLTTVDLTTAEYLSLY